MEYRIRKIEPQDNLAVEKVIRACLIEYGANHDGTAWADPDLCRFSEVYSLPGNCYWVAEDSAGNIIAGVGIGGAGFAAGLCELQKMYCLEYARGSGAAQALMDKAMDYAARHYSACFLETLQNMTRAQRFYEKHGFKRFFGKIASTEHYACDVRYIKRFVRA